MIDTRTTATFVESNEKDLRRQIDRSVCRALVDGEYARLLLSDPTVALEDRGCPPQQYRSLRDISASNLHEFALQAQTLFWAVETTPVRQEDQRTLAAAAAL